MAPPTLSTPAASEKVRYMMYTPQSIASILFRRTVSAIAALTLTACLGCDVHTEPAISDDVNATESSPGESEAVPVLTVDYRQWPTVTRVQGSLHGDENAIVGSHVAGLVQRVDVDLGSQVKKGDVLATLDPEEFELAVRRDEAQVAQVAAKLGLANDDPIEKLNPMNAPSVREEKAVLDEARAKVERAKALYNRRAIPVEELQQMEALKGVAEARLQSALSGVEEQIALLNVYRAQLGIAKQNQKNATIRAPFDGTVQQRHVAPGVYVPIGAPVVTLIRTSPLRFRAAVPERDALRVDVGQGLRIEIEGRSKPIEAEVTRISPSLDLANRTLTIEADIPNQNGKYRAGLFAEAEIILEPKAKTLAVPEAAVTHFAGIEKIWLVEAGEATETPVTIGRKANGWVEVLKGVEPGAYVVSQSRLGRHGPVEIMEISYDAVAGRGDLTDGSSASD